MRTVYIDESTKGIRLGYQMENAYEQIVYTAPEDWTGSITCFLLKPGDTRAVPILSTQEGRTITSTLTEANLAEAGRGAVEYLMSDGTVIAKSKVWPVYIATDIMDDGGDPPEEYQSWVNNLMSLGAVAEQAVADAQAEAVLARSYARGDTESRSGEETDNADYYRQQSASSAASSADSAAASAASSEESEAWAVGTKDGVPVGQAAPQYQMDSRWWAGKSADARDASVLAQEAAETAQGKAEDAQDLAETARDSAIVYAEQAKGYRDTAEGFKNAAQGSAEDAQSHSRDSEAYAKGTRGGTAISEGDPAYHNNSKFWSDQSAASADASAASAAQAATSVANSGIIEMHIDANEHLIYTRTEVVAIDFDLNANGHLVVKEAL